MLSTYQNKLVAFVDILGFSNLVKESETNDSKAQMLLSSLRDIESFIKREEELYERSESIGNNTVSKLKVNYTQFSDSIILSTDIVVPEIDGLKFHNINNIMNMCTLLSYLQARFLNEGVLLRGGLTWGPIFHEKNICFGPAFIKAYLLESELANTPRIVIDPSITSLSLIPTEYEDYDLYPFLMENTLKGNMFLEDEVDGNYFINFMLLQTFKKNAESVFKKVSNSISDMDVQDEKQKRIIKKRQWVMKEINKFLKDRRE
ncbi:MAG: hypothetical protein IKE29_18490 [Paenibacillus sp.]|uniref:hypothetical protein n=1 Tax=Paenibacillus sp. TaxID=58172 RepID=UPI0025FBFE5B|nr:hypothetical protein [Paenibacillus sp.]MBR2566586.1 hypothetical protein [Paenibacillus sp.]